jgi:hypothetical protein
MIGFRWSGGKSGVVRVASDANDVAQIQQIFVIGCGGYPYEIRHSVGQSSVVVRVSHWFKCPFKMPDYF